MRCNFSIGHYREILRLGLQNGYQFIGYDEVSSLSKGVNACVLRHDIDYVPEWSIRFAEIEHGLGIRATYFFQIAAKTYNLVETVSYRTIHALREIGHTVGLHVDVSWKGDIEWENIRELCEEQKRLFEAITGIRPCEIISFHNPHRFKDRILNQMVPNIRHTYEPTFFSEVKYLSDSQGWYEGCMCEMFRTKKYDIIQFLAHPYIWPEQNTGDFITNVASMIKFRTDELATYVVEYHPVCKRNEVRLREELRRLVCSNVGTEG